MRKRLLTLAALATLSLGAVACSPAETEESETEVAGAANEAEEAAGEVKAALREEAAQVGSAITAVAGQAVRDVDQATDQLAADAAAMNAEGEAEEEAN
jgi:hypothetical protein